jgi:hypothetical protein
VIGRQLAHRLVVRQLAAHRAGAGGEYPGPFGGSEKKELAGTRHELLRPARLRFGGVAARSASPYNGVSRH